MIDQDQALNTYQDALDNYEHARLDAIAVAGALRVRRKKTGSPAAALQVDARLFRWHETLMQLLTASSEVAWETSREVVESPSIEPPQYTKIREG